MREVARRRLLGTVRTGALLVAVTTILAAQTPPAGSDTSNGGRRRNGGASDNSNGSDRRNMSPQDLQARMLTALRDRMEVPDDDEWKVISDRITKVMELRRSSGAGMMAFGRGGFGGNGGTGGGDTSGRGTRGTGGSPEVAALAQALRDKLPDAELKSRLERLHETRKDNEAMLAKAQDELRAVLSIRQEALAVLSGLLP